MAVTSLHTLIRKLSKQLKSNTVCINSNQGTNWTIFPHSPSSSLTDQKSHEHNYHRPARDKQSGDPEAMLTPYYVNPTPTQQSTTKVHNQGAQLCVCITIPAPLSSIVQLWPRECPDTSARNVITPGHSTDGNICQTAMDCYEVEQQPAFSSSQLLHPLSVCELFYRHSNIWLP